MDVEISMSSVPHVVLSQALDTDIIMYVRRQEHEGTYLLSLQVVISGERMPLLSGGELG